MAPRRILVANRGEIALRVIRAVREMGDIPLAIFSKADRMSQHVSKSDMAVCVGEGPSTQSYLDQDAVIKAAKRMKADAIHPGYGFLSEKADFAKSVASNGMIWVGPAAEIIAKMGDKVEARRTMGQVGGLPLVPGSKDGYTDENKAFEIAKEVGYPIMIKALAGGGGRGMRVVEKESEFLNLFRRAHSEAAKAFGDGRLYLERYIGSPHHIEVQVIGDSHGNLCHLFERECSVQRRHQKVIEETPSPFVSEATRSKLLEAAVKACKEIGYVNAGTIEFLMDENQKFYFMEMNTRLQVEHPVTEWVTGIDLVREQINVAFGAKLSFTQEQVTKRGHSIEFRINAEDPEKFLPQSGRVTQVNFPRGVGIRVDSHVYRGYDIPVFYDSMIAKISVWAGNRQEAIARGKAALTDTTINGIKTNLPLHLQLLENEKFVKGDYTTKLIGTDFNYKEPVIPEDDVRMAMIATAVSAFSKEYKDGSLHEDEHSKWKSLGRGEALR